MHQVEIVDGQRLCSVLQRVYEQCGTERPDELLFDLARFLADPFYNIAGHHIYCFNQVVQTEQWRHEFLESLHGKT